MGTADLHDNGNPLGRKISFCHAGEGAIVAARQRGQQTGDSLGGPTREREGRCDQTAGTSVIDNNIRPLR